MELEITSILIGIIGAILGMYFKENFRLAKTQKTILGKLRAYLEYDHRRFLINSKEISFLKSFNSGLSTKNFVGNKINNVDKLLIEVKSTCDNKKKEIEKIDKRDAYQKKLYLLYMQIKNKEGDFLFLTTSDFKNIINDLKNNVVFISDDEASQLDYKLAYLIIHYKGYAISTLEAFAKIIIYSENVKKYEYDEFNRLIWKFLEDLSCLLNLFDLLLGKTIQSSKKNTTWLAIRNIFN